MVRYVALFLSKDRWRVRAIDAPDMEVARVAANLKFKFGHSHLAMLTSDQAEQLKDSLEKCESKRVADVEWEDN
jgi:hypothetical protein